MSNYLSPTKQMLNQLMEIEYMPVESNYSIINHEKLSLDKLSSIGLNLANIINTIKENKGITGTSETLFRLVPPEGKIKGVLQFKNGKTIVNYVNLANGQITNRGTFEAVAKTTSSINPYALLITAAVSIVTKKLDTIKEKQIEILEYIKIHEESKIKGNIKVLQEISEQLQFNINNDQFKNNKLILIQDIKKDSEANIISCKTEITSKASKTNFFHFDKSIKNKTNQIETIFRNYQLALYQFSYSSFLEVMLYENFDQGYLDCVYNKVIDYIEDFKKIHSDCYDRLISDSNTSIESTAIRGFAGMTKGIGKVVQKISLTTTGEDEKELLEFSDKVKDYNKQRIENKLDSFLQNQESCSLVFANNIQTINNLFNEEVEVLCDDENLYISTTKSNLK